MEASLLEFDAPAYARINRAREDWLARVIERIPFRRELHTALDVGCGAGYFSRVLHDFGFDTLAVDLRDDNIGVCRERFEHIAFETVDLDREFELPRCDLVLLFGILYHLQSPLQTLLRLGDSIGRIAVVSTRVAAGHESAMYLFRENPGRAHNFSPVTVVPTLPALVAMFCLAGLEHVYLPQSQPDHPQWNATAIGRRYSFLAAREHMRVDGWRRLKPGRILRKWQPVDQ